MRITIMTRFLDIVGFPSANEPCELGLSNCKNYVSEEDYGCLDYGPDSPMPIALSSGDGDISLWFETLRAIMWGFTVYIFISMIEKMNQRFGESDFDKRKVQLFRSGLYAIPPILYIASFVFVEIWNSLHIVRMLLLLFMISIFSTEFVRVFKNKKIGSYVLIGIIVLAVIGFIIWLYTLPVTAMI